MYEDQADTLRGYQRALFKGSPEETPEATAKSSPISYVDAVSAPLLVIQGSHDTRCPPRQMIAYEEKMKAAGKDITIEVSGDTLPAMQAAVIESSAAAQPQLTSAHSEPISSAMRSHAANISSSMFTNAVEASAMAWRTSGSSRLPDSEVKVPLQLMSGVTPSERYVGAPSTLTGPPCPARRGS